MRIKKQAAFTLVETLLYSFIVSIIILAIMSLSIQLLQSKASQGIRNEIQNTIDEITILLEYNIREAASVDATNSIFNNDSGKLQLNMVDTNLNPTSFTLTGSDIIFVQNTTSKTLNSSNVEIDRFNIQRITFPQAPDHLVIEMTVSSLSTSIYPNISYPIRVSYSLNPY